MSTKSQICVFHMPNPTKGIWLTLAEDWINFDNLGIFWRETEISVTFFAIEPSTDCGQLDLDLNQPPGEVSPTELHATHAPSHKRLQCRGGRRCESIVTDSVATARRDLIYTPPWSVELD